MGVSGPRAGACGDSSLCSGGGDGRFDTRGLSSLSASSLGRFAVSAFGVSVDGPLSGPKLVARSANLRLRPFSGSPPSDSEARRVCGRLGAVSCDSSASSAASSTESSELGGCDAKTSLACVWLASWNAVMLGWSDLASCWECGPCCHLMSSTPWLICRTLTSWGGETPSTGECGWDGVRERDWVWVSSTSSSRVVSRCTRPFFAGDFTSSACYYGKWCGGEFTSGMCHGARRRRRTALVAFLGVAGSRETSRSRFLDNVCSVWRRCELKSVQDESKVGRFDKAGAG